MIDRSLPWYLPPIYSKYGHFCLQEVRFVSFVVFHDDMRDLHSGNTQISYFLRSRRALRCVFDAWIYDIPTQSISYTCVYTICSRHTEALSTSSASNALCGISYETPETLDMRSEHKPPPTLQKVTANPAPAAPCQLSAPPSSCLPNDIPNETSGGSLSHTETV